MGQKAFRHSLGTSFTLDLSTGSQGQRFGRRSDGESAGARARSGERRARRHLYCVVGLQHWQLIRHEPLLVSKSTRSLQLTYDGKYSLYHMNESHNIAKHDPSARPDAQHSL